LPELFAVKPVALSIQNFFQLKVKISRSEVKAQTIFSRTHPALSYIIEIKRLCYYSGNESLLTCLKISKSGAIRLENCVEIIMLCRIPPTLF